MSGAKAKDQAGEGGAGNDGSNLSAVDIMTRFAFEGIFNQL